MDKKQLLHVEAPAFSDLANLGFALRMQVFVIEQDVPKHEEFDQYDLSAMHFVSIKDGDVIATLRLIEHKRFMQISRFVVRKQDRGRGVGASLLSFVLARAEKLGFSNIYLEAQVDKVPFYERFGFQPYGETFMDGGIPHLKMKNFGSVEQC